MYVAAESSTQLSQWSADWTEISFNAWKQLVFQSLLGVSIDMLGTPEHSTRSQLHLNLHFLLVQNLKVHQS